MPLPALLKKLSSKSLKPKSSSRPGTPNSDKAKSKRKASSELSPPLPSSPAGSRAKSPLVEANSSEKKTNGTVVTMPTPMPNPPTFNGNSEFSPEVVEAWNASHKEAPKSSGVESFLNKIEDGYNSTAGAQKVVNTLLVPVQALVNTSGLAEAIEKGVNGFMEAVPTLMKALDEVSKVHPFISARVIVAVLAFKAVYTLEVTRRENDKKIIALFVEMKDMMAVLVQLKDVKDIDQIGPDNQTIKGRLQELCTKSATDIRECANTCDTFSKKKLVVKIFAGPIWEGKLVAFAGLFTKRRQEFEFSLTIHTAVGVDEANLKLVDVDSRTREINEKMEVMLLLFQKFITPEQRDVALYIKSNGIDPNFKDEKTVKDLLAYEAKVSTDQDSDVRRAKHEEVGASELRKEISEDPDQAIKTNAELFDRKFDIQRRQIEADVARAVRREGDRVIAAVTSGPHDRIVDSEVFDFWKDMGWRGSVKARHFIAALRDHYQEKAFNDEGKGLPAADKWTLDYINPNYAQQLQEAFDDDASGFVTVQEVNRFTQLRPRDWSLPHWLAYWSIGWQAAVTDYCAKIDKIFTAMFDLLDKIKPMNRRIVDEYLVKTWDLITVFTFPVQKFSANDTLKARFEPWVTSEEERLKKNLEEIRYDIDTFDTVSLITGPGRIEMYFFPLIYLILKRHLEIIALGQTHIIGKDELWDAWDTLQYLGDAAFFRLQHMRNIFNDQRLDVKLQFKSFARGMFSQMEETDIYFVGENLRKLPDPVTVVDDEVVPKELDPAVILNFPTRMDITIDYSAYDFVEPYTPEEGDHPALGPWENLLFSIYNRPLIPKLEFTIVKGDDEGTIKASGIQYEGGNDNPYTLEGTIAPVVDGFADVGFKITYRVQYIAMLFEGRLDVAEGSIRGTWLYADGDAGGSFVLKRSAELLLFYPSPSVLAESPARTRWRFALDFIRYKVRRDMWSKAFFLDRFRDRKRYTELATRDYHYGKDLDAEQRQQLTLFYRDHTAADLRFYTSIINRNLATTSIHTSVWCDSCESKLGRARTICLDCRSKSSTDFCEDPSCSEVTIGLDQRKDLEKPHVPIHDVIKVYTVLHGRYYAMTDRKAKETLRKARQLFHDDKPKTKTGTSEDAPADTHENKPPKATCSHCKESVSLSPPCWACVQCPELFICDSCDEKGLAFTDKHTKRHAIVRCKRAAEDVSTEERLISLEARLGKMERTLNNVLGKLEREDILRVSDVVEEVAAETTTS